MAHSSEGAFAAISESPQGERLTTRPALKKDGPRGRVVRDGGEANAGLVTGFSVITRGEAKGWGYWIDEPFLEQVVAAGSRQSPRVKSRFTHPDLSSDGLGKLLGRVVNFRRQKDQVLADLEVVASAHETPDGDLAAYVMNLADESPDLFASSIVFYRDRGAEAEFKGKHSDEDGTFNSPDERNKKNLPHYRLKSLEAVDVVDEPAANPSGFFSSSGASLLGDIERGLDYALGLTEELPEKALLDRVHPERARRFLTGYLARKGLTVTQSRPEGFPAGNTGKESDMDPGEVTLQWLEANKPELVGQVRSQGAEEEAAKAAAEASEAERKAEQSAEEKLAAARTEGAEAELARLKALKEAFPERAEFALEQFEAGASLEEGKNAYRDLRLAELEKENAKLKKAVPAGAEPVGFDGEPDEKSHLERAKDYQAEHGGPEECSLTEALRRTAPKRR